MREPTFGRAGVRLGDHEAWGKRLLDILLSAGGCLCSVPLWGLIALAIKLEDGAPVFYAQERVGQHGRVFRVLKFRSMVADAEHTTGVVWATTNDSRVTRVGRLLRATALDELPQLFNILRGEMSFVGPRPERPAFVEQFRREIPGYDLRLRLRPGLTGLAQVYGRYDSDPRQKLRYDLLYLRKHSLLLDSKLVGLSLWITFRGRWQERGDKLQRIGPPRRSGVGQPRPSATAACSDVPPTPIPEGGALDNE